MGRARWQRVAVAGASVLSLAACTTPAAEPTAAPAPSSTATASDTAAPSSTPTAPTSRALSCGTVLGEAGVRAVAGRGHTVVGLGSYAAPLPVEPADESVAASRTLRCTELAPDATVTGVLTYSEFDSAQTQTVIEALTPSFGEPSREGDATVFSTPANADGTQTRVRVFDGVLFTDNGKLGAASSPSAMAWSLTPAEFEQALPPSNACESYLHFDVASAHELWQVLTTHSVSTPNGPALACQFAYPNTPPDPLDADIFRFTAIDAAERARFDAMSPRGKNLDGAPIYPFDGPGAQILYPDGMLRAVIPSSTPEAGWFVRRSHTWMPVDQPQPEAYPGR